MHTVILFANIKVMMVQFSFVSQHMTKCLMPLKCNILTAPNVEFELLEGIESLFLN